MPAERLPPVADLTPGDLGAMRLLLRGESVIDWHRLQFEDLDQVDRFLRVNEIDPSSDRDLLRLEEIRREAVGYLRRALDLDVPREVAERASVRELLLLASRPGPLAPSACSVLKVMHVMHHLAGRALLFKLPVSDDEIFHLVEAKVMKVVEDVRGAGYPVVEFAWGRKQPDGLITKLLAKRATIAAHVYDKLRFRLITPRREDLPPLVRELLHRLIPFNYVTPGESVNDLVDLPGAPPASRPTSPGAGTGVVNEFSGPDFRIVSFVADLPVRLDDFIANVSPALARQYGSVVFVLTEFQLVDAATAAANEEGESSHERYKERQYSQVRRRLAPPGPAAPTGGPSEGDRAGG